MGDHLWAVHLVRVGAATAGAVPQLSCLNESGDMPYRVVMGFALSFCRMAEGLPIDADRAGLKRFLTGHRLTAHPETRHLTGANGMLSFGNQPSDLTLDPLDAASDISSGIWHATLLEEECHFIFDMCIAGGMLIQNAQANPMILVPAQNHALEDLPTPDDGLPRDQIAWVANSSELRRRLAQPSEERIP